MLWFVFQVALYRGKCLTSINSNVSICLCIFNFFIYYYFSVLCPVDVQGVLFRCRIFCCGYNNVMILFSGFLWDHGNSNKTKFVRVGKKIHHKYSKCFLWELYFWCVPCYSDRRAGTTGNLTRKGLSSFKDSYGCFMEMTCSEQKLCCSELVTEENIKKKAASFLLPALRLTVLWKVF